MTPEVITELKSNNGFIHNTRRGTANFFSCDALFSFLEENGLSHVIRAHEVQEAGFQVTVLSGGFRGVGIGIDEWYVISTHNSRSRFAGNLESIGGFRGVTVGVRMIFTYYQRSQFKEPISGYHRY